jgi:succinate dehydrogenase flavin-adding protein (antitoxin of CptAB toxin-antitoxin module)
LPPPLLTITKRRVVQHINRMLYRSKQRGFLELDLLIVSSGGFPAPVHPARECPARSDAAAVTVCPVTVCPAMLRCSPSTLLLLPTLIQGMWAEKELPGMGPEMARDFDVVLDQENPDMFKWLTAQVHPCLQPPLGTP